MKLFRKVLWLASVGSAAGMAMLVSNPAKSDGQENLKQISIISTASVNGEVAPCG